MNTHKPDPSVPIDTTNLEPVQKVTCACNPAEGVSCMLHFDLDGFILAKALEENNG